MERLVGFGVRWKIECAVEIPSQQVEVTTKNQLQITIINLIIIQY